MDINGFLDYLALRTPKSAYSIYAKHLDYMIRSKELTPEMMGRIETFLHQHGISNGGINNYIAVANKYFEYKGIAYKHKLLPVEQKHRDYYPPEMIDKLYAVCKDLTEILVISLLYNLALRVSEMLSIMPKDIDFVNGSVTVVTEKKRGKIVERRLPLGDDISKIIQEYIRQTGIQPNEYLFPFGRANVWYMVRELSRRANLPPMSPHSLRHMRASHLNRMGEDPFTLKDFLGHSSIQTTQLYVHTDPAKINMTVNSQIAPKLKRR